MTDGEASSSDRIPPRELARLLLRTWLYLRPQIHHIILLFGLIFTGEALLMGSAFLGADLFSNKVLVGEKLEPEQARLFLFDDSYVREADTSPTTVGDDDAEPPELLTDGQRRNVRNGVFLLFGLAWYLRFLIGQCRDYYQVWILQRINQALRVAMIEKAEHLSLRYHSHAQTGDAIYRVYQDSAMITSVVSGVILFPIEAIGYLVFGLVMITIFSPAIGLLLVAGFIPGVWYIARYTPQLQRRSLAARQTNARLTSRIQEAFASIRVVKANLAERAMAGRFDGDSANALDAAFYFRLHLYVMWIGIWVLTGFLMLLALYLMAGWTVRGEATFVAGAIAIAGFTVWNLGAFQYTQGRLEFTAAYGHVLAAVWGNLQDLTMGLRRAYLLLDLEPDVADRADAVALPARIERIRFDDVAFSYVPLVPVLQGVTLTASRGTVTAIVGASGSGKSTLMSLLLRLYDPDSGAIVINGTDLKDIRIASLRRGVAIALQQNVLFAASVADNIAYAANDVSPADVEGAARIACADEFIRRMPQGYLTELGERGGKLSTGQRQRLSIARAVVRDTPILILDEPTAALDAETEHRVLANLAEWGRERIVFLITHRLSTIRNADQIAFLEDGIIAETGSHDELMDREQGAYRRFVAAELVGEAADG